MSRTTLALMFFLFSAVSLAAVPEKEILSAMEERLVELQKASAWKEYVQTNRDKFPNDTSKPVVVVDKLSLKVKGETFTLGIGSRQFVVKSTMERAKKILNSPELFKDLFGLDADSKVSDTDGVFKARIFKKVPVLSNQDYILEYTNDHLIHTAKAWHEPSF